MAYYPRFCRFAIEIICLVCQYFAHSTRAIVVVLLCGCCHGSDGCASDGVGCGVGISQVMGCAVAAATSIETAQTLYERRRRPYTVG